ncbi:hypothetical protein SAMN05444339_104111 [Loktanella atrilutea]|uniref:Uncharacterized protein n=1 Tax=Loktanella atrilutea TaxID=366533 RepID=A0A1M4ZSU5_LOKAT|nr:hypothetical protein [Loktanella atrilutea]SHF21129.1 hypothetical protein SAMN05444339_104111 [Loktanella atrilutea]
MAQTGEATKWIENQEFFNQLSMSEKQEAGSFSFIWGVFELQVMTILQKAQPYPSMSLSVARDYAVSQHLPDCDLSEEKAYFRAHFFESDGAERSTWPGASFREHDRADEIKDVLLNSSVDHSKDAEILIRVVYRFRNNFFHGYKWAYRLQGQAKNFANSSSVLIKLMPQFS